MRLEKYIFEGYIEYGANRSKVVDENFAYDFIKKYCKKAGKGTPIFRGYPKYDEDIYFIDPTIGENRVSPYASYNYYNLLMSNLPSWSKYPKRNKSIIGTTDYSDAEGRNQGNPYLVIPKDGTDVGVCSDRDIWDSFPRITDNMGNFNDVLHELLSSAKINRADNPDRDYKSFVKICNRVDRVREDDDIDLDNISYVANNTGDFDWVINYNESSEKLIDFLNDLLSPHNNDFSLVKIGSKLPDNNEVWLSAPSLLVRVGTSLANSLGYEYG